MKSDQAAPGTKHYDLGSQADERADGMYHKWQENG